MSSLEKLLPEKTICDLHGAGTDKNCQICRTHYFKNQVISDCLAALKGKVVLVSAISKEALIDVIYEHVGVDSPEGSLYGVEEAAQAILDLIKSKAVGE